MALDKKTALLLKQELEALWSGKGSLMGSNDRVRYSLTVNRATTDGERLRLTVEITPPALTGGQLDAYETMYLARVPPKANYPMMGLKAEHLHQRFSIHGTIYELVGADWKRRKYPLRARIVAGAPANQLGKFIIFPISRVAEAIKQNPGGIDDPAEYWAKLGQPTPSELAAIGAAVENMLGNPYEKQEITPADVAPMPDALAQRLLGKLGGAA